MDINTEKENFFLNLIKEKRLILTLECTVFNTKTKRFIGYTAADGYKRISYMDPETRRIYKIGLHRLIWLVFIGPIPNELVINHKDGNKLNNSLDNLEVVTHLENMQHAKSIGVLPDYAEHFRTSLEHRKKLAVEKRKAYEENHKSPNRIREKSSGWGSYWLYKNEDNTRIKWKDSKGPIPDGYRMSLGRGSIRKRYSDGFTDKSKP